MSISLAAYLTASAHEASTDLHLIHCTTVGSGLAALAAGALEPRPCKVYGADLLYLFYGRPAFKPTAGSVSNIIDYAPICLVLDPILLESTIRVLPFDSGGFERYANLIGRNLQMSSFELGSGSSMPRRLVGAYYKSNRNYYDQVPTLREMDIPVTRLTARAYARLIADPSLRDDDDRCATIELQYSTSISLQSALRAIIAPAAVLADSEVKEALNACPNAIPLSYKTYGRFSPLSFSNSIYERVDTFLESEGLFS